MLAPKNYTQLLKYKIKKKNHKETKNLNGFNNKHLFVIQFTFMMAWLHIIALKEY